MVNWTIFDGLAIRGAKSQSLARRRQLEQSYKDLAANLVDTARNEAKLLEFARRDMEMTNRLLSSSAGALREKKADAARGLASASDVSTAEMYNKDLEIRAYNARSDYLMKVGDFLSTLQQDPALANLPTKS
jgi:outer membrane protein TolC